MPLRRTRVSNRRWRRQGMRARRLLGLQRRRRLMYNPTPTFTETYVGNPILFNQAVVSGQSISANLIQFAFNDIPQVAQYCALYNQYCIRKITAIFMPAFNVYDQPAVGSSVTQVPRFVYAIQDSADTLAPTSELDVLKDNGAKIRMFTKPIKVSWRPVPVLNQTSSVGGVLIPVSKKNQWLSTNAPGLAHNALSTCFTCDTPPAGNPPIAQVYFKVTFSLKDPK